MSRPTPQSRLALAAELAQTRLRLSEAEETLAAIRSGEVDAVVVSGPEGERVFSLQGAETPYRSLIEAINEGALLLMPNGTILYANARFAGLVKVPLERVIGSSWERFFPVTAHAYLQASLASKQGNFKVELLLQAEDGSNQPVEVSVSEIKNPGLLGFAAIVTSLKERKLAEAALSATNEKLHAQTAKLQDMVTELQHVSYAISHDMRAPLRAMQGFASFLLEEAAANKSSAEAQDYCRRIMAATTRLDQLIHDALSYTTAVLQEVPLQAIDLDRLMRSLVETYPNLSPQAAEIRLEGRLPVVLGGEALLTQCFSNLLGNAVKFVPKATRPSIRIYAETLPGMVRIWVEDNGIGIPECAQPRLFGMFQRLNDQFEGTGIGLAIVRKVVERMGGHVGAVSEPGAGSRFWVDLHPAPTSEDR